MPPFYGKAVIFSAPSGSGKTTLVHHLLASNSDLSFSISATTREKRPNEVPNKDYYYLTPAEFRQKLQENAFVEWQEVYRDRFYGTLKTEIEPIWADNKHVIFDVDVKGGINLKNYFGSRALAIFICPPSVSVLADRLKARNTDSSESIQQRIEKAQYELKFESLFDTTVINDDLEEAKQEVQRLYREFTREPSTA